MEKAKRKPKRPRSRTIVFLLLQLLVIFAVGGFVLWFRFLRGQTPTIDDAIIIYEGGQESVRSLAFSPDSTLLASAHADGHIRLWNTTTFELAHDLYIPPIRSCQYDVRSVEFSADGSQLVVARGEGLIHIVDVPSGELVMAIDTSTVTQRDNSCFMRDARLSSDGTTIFASGDLTGLWDAETGEFIDGVEWGIVRIASDRQFAACVQPTAGCRWDWMES